VCVVNQLHFLYLIFIIIETEVDVINDAEKETGSSIGKGDGKAAWVNTFDLNEPEVEEDQPDTCI